ncbi:MAG: hypothetical protein HEQ10_06220 [Dolichospermum sp. DEX182a]|nr:hypothetical protein [Dolichospermum sp. DEX182a]
MSLRHPMIKSAQRTIGVIPARGAYTQVLGIKLGDREQGTGNREHRNRKQGTGNRKQETGKKFTNDN